MYNNMHSFSDQKSIPFHAHYTFLWPFFNTPRPFLNTPSSMSNTIAPRVGIDSRGRTLAMPKYGVYMGSIAPPVGGARGEAGRSPAKRLVILIH